MVRKRGGRNRPLGTRAPLTLPQGPDQRVMPVDPDMVLVSEGRNCEVDRRCRSVRLCLRLGKLHRPPRVTILLLEPSRLVLPLLGDHPP